MGQALRFDVHSSDVITNGLIRADAEGTLIITATVDAALDFGVTSLTNSAALESNQTARISDTASTTIARPNVTIRKAADRTLLTPGDMVTFSLEVLNSGAITATEVIVQDALPATSSFTYVSGSTRLDGVVVSPDPVNADQLSLNLGALGANESATISFQMEVATSGVPAGFTTYENTASVSNAGTSGSRESETVVVTIATSPLLRIAKTASPGALEPGDLITYTITISNAGDSDALDVLMSDPIPANSSFERGTLVYDGSAQTDAADGDVARYEVSANRVVYDVGTLAAGGSRTMTFVVRVDTPLPPGATTLDNTATVYASNAAARLATASSAVDAFPELSIVKSAPNTLAFPVATLAVEAADATELQVDDASQLAVSQYLLIGAQQRQITAITGNTVTVDASVNAPAGDEIIGSLTYAINYSNDGHTAANNVVVSDTLPGGVTFVTATAPYSYSGGVVTWNIDMLPADSAGSRDVTVLPGSSGRLVNLAAISSSATGVVTATATTDVGGLRLHKVTTTPVVDQTLQGAETTYVIEVHNTLPTAASDVIITDTLPAGFTFAATVAVSGHSNDTPAISPAPGDTHPSWGTFEIPGNGTLSITFTADISPGVGAATYQNDVTATAAVAVTPFDSLATTAEDVRVRVPAVLLSKSVTPSTALAGSVVTYTITATNNGDAAAVGLVLTDTLPAGFHYVDTVSTSATAATRSAVQTPSNDLLPAWGIWDVQPGGVVTIQFQANVGAASGVFSNTVSATADNALIPSAIDTAVVTVTPAVDLAIEKRSAPAPVVAGETITYTIVVSNTGPNDAIGALVTDTFPAEISGVSWQCVATADSSCSASGSGDIADSVTLLAGGVLTYTASGTVDISATAAITNLATVTAPDDVTDADPENNSDDDTTTPQAAAPVIAATKVDGLHMDADSSGAVSPGDTLVYTVTIRNTGTAAANGVQFSDDVGANTALVVGSVQSSQGTVTSGNTAGDSSVAVDVGTLSAGAAVTVIFEVRIDHPFPSGVTAVSNQGLISSDELPDEPTDDPDTGDEDDATDTPVFAEPALQAEKVDGLHSDADNNGYVSPGDTVVYTVTIRNDGNTAANNVAFSDSVDANTVLVVGSVQSDQGTVASGNTAGDGSVAVDLETVNAGEAVRITFQVTINNPLPSGVTAVYNQGLVSSDELPDEPTDDPDSGEEDDATETPVTAEPALEATKADALAVDADGDGTVSPGDTLVYTVTIGNNGNTAANNVAFSDSVDANTALIVGSVQTSQGSVTSGNTTGDGSVAVDVGTIDAGGAVEVTFQVTIDNPFAAGVAIVSNQGVVSSDELPDEPTDDPDSADEDDATETPVNAAPVLEATKVDSLYTDADNNGYASPGDTLSYTVAVRNDGNTAASNVTFSDSVDANTTLIVGSVESSQGSVTSGNGAGETSVGVAIGAIGAGDTVEISFLVAINNPLPTGVSHVSNQGLVSSDELPDEPTDDPDTGDEDDATETPVTAEPALAATKVDGLHADADNNGYVSPGDTLIYTVIIRNDGNTAANGVQFSDTVDANTALVVGSVQSSQGAVTRGNRAGDASVAVNIGSIGAGAAVQITFRVTIDAPLPGTVTRVYNQGVVRSDELPDEPTDDPDTREEGDATETRVPQPGVLIQKTLASADPAYLTQLVTYTLRITNTGNSALVSIPLADTFDSPYLSFASAVPAPDVVDADFTASQGQLRWNDVTETFGDLAPGAGIEIQVVMTATAVTGDGAAAFNYAAVRGALDENGATPPGSDDDSGVGITILPNVLVAKRLEATGPIQVGDEITFTISITNVGWTNIVSLPLVDSYDAGYLGYVRAAPGHDSFAPGRVAWDDLTEAFSDIAPGQRIDVTVVFTATAVTPSTTNTATVSQALDTFGNIAGSQSEVSFTIVEPTAVELLYFRLEGVEGQEATLVWETAAEIDNFGFYLYRAAENDLQMALDNGAIHFEPTAVSGGSGPGAFYRHTDTMPQAGHWWYWPADVDTGGRIVIHDTMATHAIVGEPHERFYLPFFVMR